MECHYFTKKTSISDILKFSEPVKNFLDSSEPYSSPASNATFNSEYEFSFRFELSAMTAKKKGNFNNKKQKKN